MSKQIALERPIYECVAPDDGSWQNDYKNRKVTPLVSDTLQPLPPSTLCGRVRSYLQGLKEEFASPLPDDLVTTLLASRPPMG